MAGGTILRKNKPMEIRVCPECNKAFYSLRESDVVACSHCGFIMHDRRGALRTKKEVDCTIGLEGESIRVKLVDYSVNGIKIVCRGCYIKADTFLDVDIKALGIHKMAKAVWSKMVTSSSSSVGLKLL